MLAESVHSVADSGNQLLLLFGRQRARRVETEQHQFGYGQERYFYGFLVAMVIFIVGALFSAYEGIDRIRHPGKLDSPVVALVVLAVAIGLEGFSLRTAVIESNRTRGRSGWRSFIRQAKAPELPAVLLEDMAALAGLLLALIAVGLSAATHDDRWDGAGSLGIGVLLAFVAIVLAREMKSLLIGESASADVEAAIVAAAEAGPEVQCVIHLRTLHIGPENLLVAAKIAVRHDETAASVAAGIDAAERRIRAAVPIAELIFLEPDIYQASRADLTDPAIRAARRRSLMDATRAAAGRAAAAARPHRRRGS
jgi:cation diffusion facilitator family transporter